jgi:hypothetical protein
MSTFRLNVYPISIFFFLNSAEDVCINLEYLSRVYITAVQQGMTFSIVQEEKLIGTTYNSYLDIRRGGKFEMIISLVQFESDIYIIQYWWCVNYIYRWCCRDPCAYKAYRYKFMVKWSAMSLSQYNLVVLLCDCIYASVACDCQHSQTSRHKQRVPRLVHIKYTSLFTSHPIWKFQYSQSVLSWCDDCYTSYSKAIEFKNNLKHMTQHYEAEYYFFNDCQLFSTNLNTIASGIFLLASETLLGKCRQIVVERIFHNF